MKNSTNKKQFIVSESILYGDKKTDKDKYIIEELEDEKYFISFNFPNIQDDEVINENKKIEVNAEVYKVFKSSQLVIKKAENEFYRKLDQFDDLIEDKEDKDFKVDDIIINSIINEKLKSAIDGLSEIQKRRVRKYFFENKTYEQIAREEDCTKRAVKFSVDIALKVLREIMKNEVN